MILLENLVEQDYGIIYNGDKWARSRTHSSLVIDREKQIFYFNAEGLVGDAFVYLTKVRKMTDFQAKEMIKYSGGTGTFIHEVKDNTEIIVYPKLVEVFHNNLWSQDLTYFNRRHINADTLRAFSVGYSESFFTFPFFVDGIFKQFQLRKDNPKTITHYYKGVGHLLYNSDLLRITKKIFIVEGITSCLIMNQFGIPTISHSGGAGTFLPEWYKYFVNQKEIYIIYDNDSAGDTGAKKVASVLGVNRCKIYNFWEYEDKGYDANDYFVNGGNKDSFYDLIENKSKFCFELEEKKFNENRYRSGWSSYR